MSDTHFDVLDELQRELLVEPSAGFVSRVRATALDAPAPRPWPWWWVGLSLTTAAAAAIAVGLWPRPGNLDRLPELPPAMAPASAFAAQSPATPDVSSPPATPPQVPRVTRAATMVGSQPGILVMTSQPDLLRRLWTDVVAAVEVESQPAPSPLTVTAEIVVAPVIVDPIVVRSPFELPAPASVPVIRRLTTEDSTRSPQ